jgi:hypothetical protein
MHLKHAHHNHSPATMQTPLHGDNTMTSTRLCEQACTQRFRTGLSAPDELHWFNNNTNWDVLSRKEFRDVLIRMETATVQFYDDFLDCTTGRCIYPGRHVAIKQFWADEWGCEYLPETGKWLDLATNTIIKSEAEKKALKEVKKALKAEKKAKKALTKEAKKAQYTDAEEELYQQAAQKQQQPQSEKAQAQAEAQTQKAQKSLEDQVKQQNQKQDVEFNEEEEAWAEFYVQAAQAKQQQQQQEQQQQEQQQQEQQEQKDQDYAQAYLDSFTYTSEEEEEEAPATRICCQAVLYIEELTDVQGDPDWRAYIYYDERIRRYVFKGTRRSVLNYNKKKTVFPEIKLCFRSSHELASYLRSSTDSPLNISMYAMSSATVKDATFAELYALPARGYKTELFGYDQTRPRFSTFVNYLRMLRDIDATHSTFASF